MSDIKKLTDALGNAGCPFKMSHEEWLDIVNKIQEILVAHDIMMMTLDVASKALDKAKERQAQPEKEFKCPPLPPKPQPSDDDLFVKEIMWINKNFGGSPNAKHKIHKLLQGRQLEKEEFSLYEVCKWWIETYPSDVFQGSLDVAVIRRGMKSIVLKIETARKKQ